MDMLRVRICDLVPVNGLFDCYCCYLDSVGCYDCLLWGLMLVLDVAIKVLCLLCLVIASES